MNMKLQSRELQRDFVPIKHILEEKLFFEYPESCHMSSLIFWWNFS